MSLALAQPREERLVEGAADYCAFYVGRVHAGEGFEVGELADVDAYVCGPPPMVEAAIEVLTDLGTPEKRIYYDKFTTTGDPDSAPAIGRAS